MPLASVTSFALNGWGPPLPTPITDTGRGAGILNGPRRHPAPPLVPIGRVERVDRSLICVTQTGYLRVAVIGGTSVDFVIKVRDLALTAASTTRLTLGPRAATPNEDDELIALALLAFD